ncbi:high-potential iron-sulfur protein [Halorubellus sp. PRR65]|uniref:high-potential iron-sulfur protein n=1 Tax=Halorubellus sp. PRR65 TaxID=3098148 RepID=UPI002B263837|nr:high-potential iron-sulfur protein [Halorubellus sp. PRR65]
MQDNVTHGSGGDGDERSDVFALLARRRYLVAAAGTAGGLASLSGCLSGNGDTDTGTEPETDEPPDEENGDDDRPAGVSEDEFENGPVPEAYRTAVSLGGETRDPDDLQPKGNVKFSEYDDALDRPTHEPGRCCANCADYVPDKNGDGFGACAEVEGYVDGADWCSLYESLPEPSVPEDRSEDDLATAEVPEGYRTATSQGGETRDPEQLSAQADVSLTESVEAIADGDAEPGQSCGNCAEFVPDQNDDGWGACAAVEGYVASEDWCVVWEHVSEG